MESKQTSPLSSSGPEQSVTPFARYDNARFIVFLRNVADSAPLRGTARFERDDMLGNTLRISLMDAGPGSPAIIVSEKDWDGVIVRDSWYGADYCLIPAPDWQTEKDHEASG